MAGRYLLDVYFKEIRGCHWGVAAHLLDPTFPRRKTSLKVSNIPIVANRGSFERVFEYSKGL